MKIALESPVELTDSHLEGTVDVCMEQKEYKNNSLDELDTV